jgi:radical SAM protein with 4Fe4S-binding SPASM domain
MYGCNMGCQYCYVGWSRNHVDRVLPDLDITRRILKNLKDEGVEEIVLLGGEPTLHPHFVEICRSVDQLEFLDRGVVSNGSAFSPEMIAAIKENRFWVDITFRGVNAQTFDTTARHPGAFKKAVEAAVELSRAGVSLGVEFDCTPHNYTQLFDLAQYLQEKGVYPKQIQLHRVLPAGDAAPHPEEWLLSPEQWRIVLDQALQIKSSLGTHVVLEDGFPFCLVDQKHWELMIPCACGYSLITIDPIGEARYCSCHGGSLGNILQKPLRQIWQESLKNYRQPSRYPKACMECALLEVCRGGCSASGWGENAGRDIFEDQLRPIKLAEGNPISPARIVGQQVVSR